MTRKQNNLSTTSLILGVLFVGCVLFVQSAFGQGLSLGGAPGGGGDLLSGILGGGAPHGASAIPDTSSVTHGLSGATAAAGPAFGVLNNPEAATVQQAAGPNTVLAAGPLHQAGSFIRGSLVGTPVQQQTTPLNPSSLTLDARPVGLIDTHLGPAQTTHLTPIGSAASWKEGNMTKGGGKGKGGKGKGKGGSEGGKGKGGMHNNTEMQELIFLIQKLQLEQKKNQNKTPQQQQQQQQQQDDPFDDNNNNDNNNNNNEFDEFDQENLSEEPQQRHQRRNHNNNNNNKKRDDPKEKRRGNDVQNKKRDDPEEKKRGNDFQNKKRDDPEEKKRGNDLQNKKFFEPKQRFTTRFHKQENDPEEKKQPQKKIVIKNQPTQQKKNQQKKHHQKKQPIEHDNFRSNDE